MECVGCHKEITDTVSPHRKAAGVPKAECAQCHLDLWEAIRKDGKAAEKPRLGIVADNVAAYKKSFHSKPDKDDPTKLMAICSDCHDVHAFDVPPRGTAERKEWHLAVPDICGKCHEDHRMTGPARRTAGKPKRRISRRRSARTATPPTTSSAVRPTRPSWRSPPVAAIATRMPTSPTRPPTTARSTAWAMPTPPSAPTAMAAMPSSPRRIPSQGCTRKIG
jgi:hypothetical protein